MLFSFLSGGDIGAFLTSLLLSLPVMALALSLHETAHGFVAWKCGDNTAYNLGRLTLNPVRHLDPIGFLCLLVFGFGWAKPVPINTRNFRNPKRGMALSALAGPVSNLLLGAVNAALFGVCTGIYAYLDNAGVTGFGAQCLYWLFLLFYIGAEINFVFAVFNLIPCPPFDGSRILLAFLPTRTYFRIMRYERQIMFAILIALLVLSRFGFSPFGWIADELTDLISLPIAKATLRLILK